MNRFAVALVAVVVGLAAGQTWAMNLSVWAVRDDIGFAPVSIAYNPENGKLLIAGTDLVEWARGAGTGINLAPAANWGDSPYGVVYVPSRGTYLVTDRAPADIIEVQPGIAGQTPSMFVDVNAVNLNLWPAGGLPQDGSYAYYKSQWTGVEQTVHRFTLAGTNGVDAEYVPYSAFQAWSSSGPSQQLTIGVDGTLYLSARNSVVKPNRGIYYWDSGAAALVPVIQQAAILALTGESN
ncbi:MAG TPA: hypothetical protein VM243_07420, partial [Phycisphaerae bacterium]|nr:hypothetical protein [Phycisphaerae bacterium]